MSGKSNQIIGRVLATLFFATVVGFWVYVTSVPTLRDATTTLTALGGVHTVKKEDGDVWFWLQGNPARYGIAQPDDGVLEILRASEESGNAVSVRIHLDGARFGLFSNDPEYWVQSVEYLGKAHGKFETRIRWSWRDMGPGNEGLLRGYALEEAWRHDEAVKALDASIESNSLRGARLALAYLTRGDALDSQAYPDGRALNDRDDRLLVRAIADYRQVAALDPSEHRALFWQGNAARSLGAYDEALALYEEVERRWPDQYFRAAILRGATCSVTRRR